VLQGFGGGMLMPIGMAVLYRLTPAHRRGAIMGLFGIPVMIAPALGPLLSGYLLEYADWRLIFLINLPVGVLALLVGVRVLPAIPAGRLAGALDWLGILLAPLAFASLSFGVSESTTAGWSAVSTLGGIGVGVVALVLFVWRELHTPDPVLDVRVFRTRDFTLGILAQWSAVAAMFGTFFLIPVFLQQVRGYGAFETGLYTLPIAIASAVFMQIGGRVFDRIGVRLPVLFGMALIATAMALLSGLRGDTTGLQMLLPMALLGAGMGSMMMALNTHLLNSAPRELVGRVTSLTTALQNVVGSLAIATFATIVQARIPVHLAETGLPDATALAFGDVYRVALVIISFGWLLVWTLRSTPPIQATAAGRAPSTSLEPAA
jgi:EmrB/QacA subfamily drug resistance transporter